MSKEEIEKAKGWLSALDVKSEFEAISKEIILQYIEQQEQENNKQSKIIDEMAKAYIKVTSEKYRINNICEKGKCQNEECHEDDWVECIKQYFEKKVEGK